VCPKTIVSGGISPKGCTSVLTVLVVMAGFYLGETFSLHPKSQMGLGVLPTPKYNLCG
jgi:hypothetical protein